MEEFKEICKVCQHGMDGSTKNNLHEKAIAWMPNCLYHMKNAQHRGENWKNL